MRIKTLTLYTGIGLATCGPAIAEVSRWPEPTAALEAFKKGNFLKSRAFLQTEYVRCQASRPTGPECLTLLLGLSNTSGYAGDPTGGTAYARTAVSVAERSLPVDHPDLARAWLQLADRLDAQHREKEAEPLYEKALYLFERVLPAGDSKVVSTIERLISNVSRQGRVAEAELLARKALALRVSMGGGVSDQAEGELVLAHLLAESGKVDEAERLYRKALGIFEKTMATGSPRLARMYLTLGGFFRDQKRLSDAEQWYRRALEYAERHSPDDPVVGHAVHELALCLEALERDADAERYFRQSLKLREASFLPGHPLVTGAYGDLARNLAYQERIAEADAVFKQMVERRPKFSTDYDLAVIQWERDYADFLNYQAHRPSEALVRYRAAQHGLLARMATIPQFDEAVQAELGYYRSMFGNMVDAAWALSEQTTKNSP